MRRFGTLENCQEHPRPHIPDPGGLDPSRRISRDQRAVGKNWGRRVSSWLVLQRGEARRLGSISFGVLLPIDMTSSCKMLAIC